MASENFGAVLHGIDDLRFEAVPLPNEVQTGYVRIAISNVGICGSDVHYLKKGRIAHYVVEAPMVIGHESAGVVFGVGAGVTQLQAGDRVALEPGVPCWACQASREGRYNLDPDIKFFATPPVHGSLARYVDHPADFCYKLPDTMSLEEGAFCEPLSVGVHACRRAGVQPGKSVAILGAGPIGLITLLVAKAFGADAIAITDVNPDNLAVARRLGATAAVKVGVKDSPQHVTEQLRAALGAPPPPQLPASPLQQAQNQPDQPLQPPSQQQPSSLHRLQQPAPPVAPAIVIDCAGFEQTIQTALHTVAPGGKVVLVGMGAEQVNIPSSLLAVKEIDFVGSFRYCNTYPLCITLLASKRVDVTPLITHRFGFSADQVAAGFDTAYRAAETGAIKVMFNLE